MKKINSIYLIEHRGDAYRGQSVLDWSMFTKLSHAQNEIGSDDMCRREGCKIVEFRRVAARAKVAVRVKTLGKKLKKGRQR